MGKAWTPGLTAEITFIGALVVYALNCSGNDSPALNDAGSDGGADSAIDEFAPPPIDSGCSPTLDFTSDAKNCGSCGHSCLGGACQAGKCQPFVLENPVEPGPRAIVADSTGAYWVDQGTYKNNYADGMVRYLGNDTATPISLAENQAAPNSIATDGSNLLFATYGTYVSPSFVGDGHLFKCSVKSCAASPPMLGSAAEGGDNILITGGKIYFTSGTTDPTVYATPIGSLTPSAATAFATAGGGESPSLATDGTALYFANTLTLSKKPLVGGTVKDLDPSNPGIHGSLAVAGTSIYSLLRRQTAPTSYELVGCALPDCAGGMTTVVVDAAPMISTLFVTSLVADGDTLYWTTSDLATADAIVVSCKPPACKSKIVLRAPNSVCSVGWVAVSPVAIYHVCGQGTNVSHLARLAK